MYLNLNAYNIEQNKLALLWGEAQARVRQGKARQGKERQGWRKVKGLKA